VSAAGPAGRKADYSLAEVAQILGLSRNVVARLIEAGFVTPARGPRREYRFSFQDLVLMRAAQGLREARLPSRRISRALKRLREQLPGDVPLRGVRIAAVGDSVVIAEGNARWRAEDGQYVLALDTGARDDAAAGEAMPHVLRERPRGRAGSEGLPEPDMQVATAEDRFREACSIEEHDLGRALSLYRAAIAIDPDHAAAHLNLGRALHEVGRFDEAEGAYRRGLDACPRDPLLCFNLGVLLEDLGEDTEARECYEAAIAEDPALADAHYNLALLHERAGRRRDALRHFSAYRRLALD
jgi:tetratricopeptide (TPR) repeat protein